MKITIHLHSKLLVRNIPHLHYLAILSSSSVIDFVRKQLTIAKAQ